jgi:hypothetical protein
MKRKKEISKFTANKRLNFEIDVIDNVNTYYRVLKTINFINYVF